MQGVRLKYEYWNLCGFRPR